MHFLYFSVRSFLVDTKKQTKRNQTQQPTLLPFQPGSFRGRTWRKLPDEKNPQKIGLGFFLQFPEKEDIQLLDHSTVTASAAATLEEDNQSLFDAG